MALKLPRTTTFNKLKLLPITSQKNSMKDPQLSPSFLKKLEQLETLNNGKWMLPQRLEPSSPESKYLASIIVKLKGDFKRNQISNRATPDVLFSKQTIRPPMPRPVFHEEKSSTSPIRQKSNTRPTKKIVILKENFIKDPEIFTSKSNKKIQLSPHLERLKLATFLDAK
jgi:hypothetical protein